MKRLLLLFLLIYSALIGDAQVIPAPPATGGDSTQPVLILPGTQRQRYFRLDDGTELQVLAGTVGLRQGNTLFYCDSLVLNSVTKIFEAYGHVHIIDDTTQIYSDYLRYHTDIRMAYLQRNVRLTDRRSTVTTNELEYDVATKIATYKNGGRVTIGKSVLTSEEGVYNQDTKDIFFRRKVELKDPGTYLRTDSMIYNTQTKLTQLITETYIRDSSGRVIRTREGTYDMVTRQATFTQRTSIDDKCLRVVGDRIANDDATGTVQIEGNAVLIDTCQGVNILANRIFANKRTEAYLATKKPLMIIRQDKDSIFVSADTLYSARLSDLVKSAPVRAVDSSVAVPDSMVALRDTLALKDSSKTAVAVTPVKGKAPARPKTPARTLKTPPPAKDSTDRYFEAYRNVRIFSDSLQAVGDSMFYSFRDSVFRLFKDPVAWNKKNQVSGDTIYLYTKNKKADRIRVFNHSFVATEVAPGVYNQIKSTRLDGWFFDGNIDSVRCRGFAESIYFMQDDDSAFTGVNQTSADILDVRFLKGDLHRVIYRSAVKGTLWPIRQKNPLEMRLPGFGWFDNRRPKSKYDLFQ
ncbi:OstA-like protein [Flaviaesturariibacter aridisoli]|uniref:OstA family protein n=1 Tax=Flaviaesturariibacter aridisoli TaxID=2545761 RepID=A0A4R4DXR8_9BACT|nr:OstA-like protein [Flaviaesturariibacter aridisoli]TCZ68087.1 OstA family protein [Flaviaesturariibacter aridisoli]